MSNQQILVSVRFQGYYLELLVPKTSTISQLVQAMRDNTFIPSSIPNDRLVYKKSNNDQLRANSKVQQIVERVDNSVHYLSVQVLSQKKVSQIQPQPIEQDKGPDFVQTQTNRILQRIVRYLKQNTIDSLLRAKDNRRIQSTMAEHLTAIGEVFLELKHQCQSYEKGCEIVLSSKSTEQMQSRINDLVSKQMDYVKAEKLQPVKDLSKYVKQMKSKLTQRQKQRSQINKDISGLNIKIDQLNSDNNSKGTRLISLQNDIRIKEDQLRVKSQQLRILQQSMIRKQQQIQQLSRQSRNIIQLKQKNNKSQLNIRQLKQKLITKERQYKQELRHKQEQIMKLQRQSGQRQQILRQRQQSIQQKIRQIQQRDKQIIRMKVNNENDQSLIKYEQSLISTNNPSNNQSNILSYNNQSFISNVSNNNNISNNNISNNNINNISNNNKSLISQFNNNIRNGNLQDIIDNKLLSDSLINIIQTQMKKKIINTNQLISYHKDNHHIYSLNQFYNHINTKKSLLFIAKPQNQSHKIFGAFTQQQYNKQPQSGYIQQFKGCSFLFSLKDGSFRFYKILDGQNSITFDMNYLVFGNQDLLINFDNYTCSSQFVQGNTISYNTTPQIGGNSTDYKCLMSDKLVQKTVGKHKVNLYQFKIYQLIFNDNNNTPNRKQ